MHKSHFVDYIWIFLIFLFFSLAALHFFLTATASLEVNLPDTVFIGQSKNLVQDPKIGPAVQDALMALKGVSAEINAFVNSYNRSTRFSNLFAAFGYSIAGLTCIFCLRLRRDPY